MSKTSSAQHRLSHPACVRRWCSCVILSRAGEIFFGGCAPRPRSTTRRISEIGGEALKIKHEIGGPIWWHLAQCSDMQGTIRTWEQHQCSGNDAKHNTQYGHRSPQRRHFKVICPPSGVCIPRSVRATRAHAWCLPVHHAARRAAASASLTGAKATKPRRHTQPPSLRPHKRFMLFSQGWG